MNCVVLVSHTWSILAESGWADVMVMGCNKQEQKQEEEEFPRVYNNLLLFCELRLLFSGFAFIIHLFFWSTGMPFSMMMEKPSG